MSRPHTTPRRTTGVALAPLVMLALVGCQGQTSPQPPIVPVRNMHEMPRYDAQEASAYFPDGRSMRPPVPGTVAREMVVDPAVDTGLADDGSYVMIIPETVVEGQGGMPSLLARGRERYGIYCTPCHGGLGDGEGMVPRVSGVAGITPPTFHQESIRRMPDGQLYATITNGLRNMPAYRAQIPVADRWAIVAYVRALQLAELENPSPPAENEQ
jgi:mono/diheme cytochrome c family protein